MYTPCHFAFQTGFNGDEDGAVENKAANSAPPVRAPLAASNPRRFSRVYSISCPAESALLRLLHFSTLLCRMNLLVSFSRARTLSLSFSAIITHSLRLIIFPFLICANKGGGNLAGAYKGARTARAALLNIIIRRVKLLFYICAAPEKVLISIKFNLEGA